MKLYSIIGLYDNIRSICEDIEFPVRELWGNMWDIFTIVKSL